MVVKNRHLVLPFALCSLLIAGCGEKGQGGGGMAAGPVEVGVLEVTMSDAPLVVELPGRTSAFRKAEVRPQVSGIIKKRLFTEGAEITAGTSLYQIDPAPYEAALASARAEQARAEANLAAAASREGRYKELLVTKAISQQEYDDAAATLGQLRASVAAAKAAVESARINLNYTKVQAPITGIIGKSDVTEGALVNAGQANALAEIHQLDPIYVDVSQSAEQLLQLRRQMKQGIVSEHEQATVSLILDDGSVYEHQGVLQFAEVGVNESTGTVTLRAQFANPDRLLLPGLFVRTRVEEGLRTNAVLVPQRGVIRDRSGTASVWIVGQDGNAELRPVVVERSIGNQWLVSQGLQPGEKLIVEGLQRLKPGVPVNAVPATSGKEQ